MFAALCHASWSAIVKHSQNPLVVMAFTSIIEIIVFLPMVFVVPLPSNEIWYFIIATTILHGLYRFNVIYSYKFGDLSFVYPIARGGSCLLIGLFSLIFLSNKLTALGFIGILVICFGLFFISYSKNIKFNKHAFFLAVTTATLIATYTLVDGIGIRKSDYGFTYIVWMLLLNGIPVLCYALISKKGFRAKNTYSLIEGFSAGILAILSYGLVVWSMQYIEIAYVSSIREFSIVIATLISFFILKEYHSNKRMLPAIIIVIGTTVVYFQVT